MARSHGCLESSLKARIGTRMCKSLWLCTSQPTNDARWEAFHSILRAGRFANRASASCWQPPLPTRSKTMSEKRPMPSAACVKCGHPAIDVTHAGTRCLRPIGHNNYCSGTYRSALNGRNDWKECPSCNGTGRAEGASSCPQCWAFGWLFVRDKPGG